MRILIVCLDNLGDLVFTSSLVEPLKERFPDAQWAILCKDYAAEIARCFSIDAKVVAADPWWDGSPGRGKGKFGQFIKALLELRGFQADIAIVTSTNWRAAAAAWFVGAKRVIGFDRKKSKRFLSDAIVIKDWEKTPVTVQLRNLLAPLSVPAITGGVPSCHISVRSDGPASKEALPKGRYAIFHPFAGDLNRCWPLSQWERLAAELRTKSIPVVWMGRSDEVHRIKAEISGSKADLFMEDYSKGELQVTLEITGKAFFLIGHDSGPIHFASALGIPVVGLYLPGDYPRTVTAILPASKVIHRSKPADLLFDDVMTAVNGLITESAGRCE